MKSIERKNRRVVTTVTNVSEGTTENFETQEATKSSGEESGASKDV